MNEFLNRLKVDAEAEIVDLEDRFYRLSRFLYTEKYYTLESIDRQDLDDQYYSMRNLLSILKRRAARLNGWIKKPQNTGYGIDSNDTAKNF